MLDFSGHHSRENISKCFAALPHINRWGNLPSGLENRQIPFPLQLSSVTFTRTSRIGRAASADVSSDRFRFPLQNFAFSTRQTYLIDTCSAAGRLTRPTKLRGLRITFTKTSPQQTDPPAR